MNYHFVDRETFEKEVAEKKFIETANYSGNFYGTSIKAVKDVVETGKVHHHHQPAIPPSTRAFNFNLETPLHFLIFFGFSI